MLASFTGEASTNEAADIETEALPESKISTFVSAAFVNTGASASFDIAPDNCPVNPEPFKTFIEYGEFEKSKADLVTVTVIFVVLFLVVETGDIVSDVPSKVTEALLTSNKEPKISIVATPLASLSIVPEVTAEPPTSSIVKPVTDGGESIDFQFAP